MKRWNNVWIRIAGNAPGLRAGKKSGWRCFVGRRNPEIPVRRIICSGAATEKNVISGTIIDDLDLNLGPVAWLDFYGTLTIDNLGVAHIKLRQPPE